MSGGETWRGILDVFIERADQLPAAWEDTFWTASMVDLAKILAETRATLSPEHQGMLVAAGAVIAAQVMKENDARDLAAATIAQARRRGDAA
ncbi:MULTISPECIES: hypothetical protein [unclassified Sphingomonas]|uniref:hypothetical protein n=1 Tax=unclassified Sphingomonas TaxID=196159 RepID=UPI002269DF88|nr:MULTISPECIES: hypothetical protein [unclassified Sphingomonas]